LANRPFAIRWMYLTLVVDAFNALHADVQRMNANWPTRNDPSEKGMAVCPRALIGEGLTTLQSIVFPAGFNDE
jgi:hypothetical protein